MTYGYPDIRAFVEAVDGLGELVRIPEVDWDLELGALTESAAESLRPPPMLLFDDIKGYPSGYRVLSLPLASPRRAALNLGLPTDKPKLELLRLAAQRMKAASPIKPEYGDSGPVTENVRDGSDVDITIFPAPRYHEQDGGRFIGTGCMVINQDPATGVVNLGTYRIQVHDDRTLGLWMSPGQHGRRICEQYWAQGRACPVVVTFGGDLLAFLSSHTKVPPGVSELDFAGGLRGAPIRVIEGPRTGLPIPAFAEIAVEGEVPPPDVESREEGPFGEWPGYYSAGSQGSGDPQPVINVQAMYHRDDPILLNMAPTWPGAPLFGFRPDAGLLWDQMEAAGIGGIAGVWSHEPYFVVVAVEQLYPGHAKQAGLAALACSATARNGRYVVVVDDDVDPTDLNEVLWAMETRVDPASEIDIIDGCWSTPLDPRMPLEKRQSRDYTNSRAVFYAVRPFHWRDSFPAVSRASRRLREAVKEKYPQVFSFTPGVPSAPGPGAGS